MSWIMSLDNGKYMKYSQQLRNGFERSQILSGDLLPELTRGDLSNSPFDINEFIIKRDLEKHFKSLTTSNMVANKTYNIIAYGNNINDENEGDHTEIIDR
eukprot:729498_1